MTDMNTLTHNAVGQFDFFKAIVGVMSAVATAGILWVGNSVMEANVAIAELRVVINRYESKQDEVFTQKEATAAIALRNARLDEMERDAGRRDSRILNMEERMLILEDAIK